jgi:hypothetical protein
MLRAPVLVALAAALVACAPVSTAPSPSVTPAPPSTTAIPAPSTSTLPPTDTIEVPPPSSADSPSQSVTATPAPSSAPPAQVGQQLQVEITYYGAYDNDPKGSTAIDGPVLHKTAGGTGTYADPLTFASPTGPGAFAYGLRIYVPSVRKYFIREDSCEVSWTAPDGCGAVTHVDLYMGNPSATKAVLKCEDALTPDGLAPIVVDPPADLAVDSVPLWTQATGTCHVIH